MSNEEVERAIEFLLNNQAQHDARLGRLENIVADLAENQKVLSATVDSLSATVDSLSATVDRLSANMDAMVLEVREGLGSIMEVAKQTMDAVRQVAEIGGDTRRRVFILEDRMDALAEN